MPDLTSVRRAKLTEEKASHKEALHLVADSFEEPTGLCFLEITAVKHNSE